MKRVSRWPITPVLLLGVFALSACSERTSPPPAPAAGERLGHNLLVPHAGCGSLPNEGCCDGQTIWWCEANQIKFLNCVTAGNLSCGWLSANNYYFCGSTGGSDPSGSYPKSCAGYFGDAGVTPTDGGSPPAPDQGAAADQGPKLACGNGSCDPGEFCDDCPQDCGLCDGCSVKKNASCPGCRCEQCVCQQDPVCCSSMWDSACVTLCQNQCGGCGRLDMGVPDLGPDQTPPQPDFGLPPDMSPPPPDAGPPCGAVPAEGCCDGQTVWWCDGGTLKSQNCQATGNLSCGWLPNNNFYFCGSTGGSDPSGKFVKACDKYFGDAGVPKSDSGPPPVPDGGAMGDQGPKPACGNGNCDPGEFCDDCPQDCGPCDGCSEKKNPRCPGCLCEQCVCQKDPICCSLMWDSDCANVCKTQCGGCGRFDMGVPDFGAMPDQSVMPPDQSVPTPDQNVVTPDQNVVTPDQNVVTPDQSQPTPDQAVATPDQGQPTPDQGAQDQGGKKDKSAVDKGPDTDQGPAPDKGPTPDKGPAGEAGPTTDRGLKSDAKPMADALIKGDTTPGTVDDEGGCNCNVGATPAPGAPWLLLLGFLALIRRRR